jgi:simple sugar transport system ATP-binding protein
MVGREIEEARPHAGARTLSDLRTLEVEGLTVTGDRGQAAVTDVTFSIREGEIVGVAGVAGNGQRELAEALSGMRDLRAGSVAVGGRRPQAEIRVRPSGQASRTFPRTVSDGPRPDLRVTSNVVMKTYRSRSLSR